MTQIPAPSRAEWARLQRQLRASPPLQEKPATPSPRQDHWQAWREQAGRWAPDGWIKPAFYADPPPFEPRPGETLKTPGFEASSLQPSAVSRQEEPIDVVIPLGTGSRHGDAELRYCLRSIEKHLENLGRVWIVGHRPAWLRDVEHVRCEDTHRSKDVNIIRKLEAACRAGVSKQFVFWSDDQVLLRPLAWSQLGPYTWGDLRGRPRADPRRWYRRLRRTSAWLAERGLSTFHCDTHVPIPMERERLLELSRDCWDAHDGLTVGTWYVNGAEVKPQPMGQRKATIEAGLPAGQLRRKIAGRWFLGFNDAGFTPELRELLDELFPEKSRWERGYTGPTIGVMIGTHRRTEHLARQLEAIHGQTLTPAEIRIWHDGPGPPPEAPGVPVIAASQNLGVWGRFFAALDFDTEYVAIFDDDTIPGRRWLENCLATLRKTGGAVGARGAVYVDGTRAKIREYGWQRPSAESKQVDVLGHCWFLRREWLGRYGLEPRCPGITTAGEDYHLSYVLQKHLGRGVWVPAQPPGQPDLWGSTDASLGHNDVALFRQPGESAKKQKVHEFYRSRGWTTLYDRCNRRWPVPSPPPRAHAASVVTRAPVLACVASVPWREQTLQLALRSLARQVDHFQVFLNGYDHVPEFLTRAVPFFNPGDRVTVYRSQDHGDLGARGKHFSLQPWHGYILTFDDDWVYPPDYVERMVAGVERYDRLAVVAAWGWNVKTPCQAVNRDRELFLFNQAVAEDTPIHVVGTGMVGWHSDTVPWLSHRSYDRNNQVDVSLSSLLEQKRIPRVMIARSQGWCFNCDLSAERSLSRGRGIDGTVERGLSETALVNLIEWTSPPMAPW